MPSNDQIAGQELGDIREEIALLLESAESILRTLDDQSERNSAEAYWLAHIRCALGGFGYSTHATTMESTISGLGCNCCGDCGEPLDDDDDGEDEELCGFCRGDLK